MVATDQDDQQQIQQLLARYAVAATKFDADGVVAIFAAGGTYSAFGSTYQVEEIATLLGAAPRGLFLVGPPAIELEGDTAAGEQPLCFVEQTTHDMRIGWYTDTYLRTKFGWRLQSRRMTFLRRNGTRDSGRAHDPLRPEPAFSGDENKG